MTMSGKCVPCIELLENRVYDLYLPKTPKPPTNIKMVNQMKELNSGIKN